jgi:hypothetical protein
MQHIELAGSYPAIPGTTLIGFGHRARHGKDSVARIIHESYPRETQIYAFADALRMFCRIERGMTRKDAQLLQQVGTNQIRQRDPETWVRTLYWTIEEKRPRFALIADCRFWNEGQLIRSTGGVTVRVRRWEGQGDGIKLFVSGDRDPNHPSEIDMNDWPWDYSIENCGTVADLETQALDVFETIRSEYRAAEAA